MLVTTDIASSITKIATYAALPRSAIHEQWQQISYALQKLSLSLLGGQSVPLLPCALQKLKDSVTIIKKQIKHNLSETEIGLLNSLIERVKMAKKDAFIDLSYLPTELYKEIVRVIVDNGDFTTAHTLRLTSRAMKRSVDSNERLVKLTGEIASFLGMHSETGQIARTLSFVVHRMKTIDPDRSNYRSVPDVKRNFPLYYQQIKRMTIAQPTFESVAFLAEALYSLRIRNKFLVIEGQGHHIPVFIKSIASKIPNAQDAKTLLEWMQLRSHTILWKALASQGIGDIPNFETMQTMDQYRDKVAKFSKWCVDRVDALARVTELVIRSYICELPPMIAYLSNLKVLQIKDNLLTTLPKEITQLSSLVTLECENNLFTAFPEEIRSLTKLQTLDVSGNLFKVIPSWIEELTELGYLDISYCSLEQIPEKSLQALAEQTL